VDPLKPGAKPKAGSLPTVAPAAGRVAPKTSFEATLTARGTKPAASTNAASGKDAILAALGQGDDAAEAAQLEEATKHFGLTLARSILAMPKGSRIQIDRAPDPNNEED
jgi:hypothetical protein